VTKRSCAESGDSYGFVENARYNRFNRSGGDWSSGSLEDGG
jgi:hypothetical protein